MYGRICITMIVSLLSSRWILMALGKEDFGIYNLVAGLLGLLVFLNLSMSTATQRFLSFYMAKDKATYLKEVFYICCILHFIVGILVLLIIEFFGNFFLENYLVVPEGKLYLATIVLHSLSISTFISIIIVPYNACLLAHENFLYTAILSIIESMLKLFAAIFLLYYSGERLILYSYSIVVIQIVSSVAYWGYCKFVYGETKISFLKVQNVYLVKDILSYVGWNLIGSVSSLLRTQGVSMLLNSFYGVTINAAYGIATQVKGQLSYFSTAIVSAARPQIIKNEGEGNRFKMLALANSTCKFTYLMLSMIAIPLIVEMPYVLKLWLKNVPEYTVSFTRLILILNLVFQFCIGISIGVESVGKIRNLQIFVGGLHFIVLPIGYIMLRNGYSPSSIFLMIIIEELIGLGIRLMISHNTTGLDIIAFGKQVFFPSLLITIFAYLLCLFVCEIMSESFVRLIFIILTSVLSIMTLAFLFVLDNAEKDKIFQILMTLKSKLLYVKNSII